MPASDSVASYYAATANPHPEHPALEGELACDVCVIGAGYTGLTAALHLAERGYAAVVLEAERVGFGASGRNGGQIHSGYSVGAAHLAEVAGREAARSLWEMAEEAKAMLAGRIARHAIACDFRPGTMLAAARPSHLPELARELDALAGTYGYREASLLTRAEVVERLGTQRFAGALYDEGGGHLHALNYCLGLADAAVAAGVRIFERSPALSADLDRTGIVRTPAGMVRADHVVLAGNAYLGRLAPDIRRRIMPVGTYIMATEPLGDNRARSLIRDDCCVCDTNFVLDYFRLSADRRLLFGGRVSYSGRDPADLAGGMRRRMLRTFPQLADVRADFVWGGHAAITMNRLPHFGRLGRAGYFAQGFSGQGVALTGLAGRLIAEAVAGTAERFDVFARLPHRPFPGGAGLRAPLLALAMAWYRLRDLL